MIDEEVIVVTVSADNVEEAVFRMVSAVQCGHENLLGDILKMMLSFS